MEAALDVYLGNLYRPGRNENAAPDQLQMGQGGVAIALGQLGGVGHRSSFGKPGTAVLVIEVGSVVFPKTTYASINPTFSE